MVSHINFLLLALKEAEKGRGFCAPNPAVGAIIVKDNTIVATGYHAGPGQPHAEVDAIRKLSSTDCRNMTIYVTLEPCNHYGRTPPCVDLLIKKQFERVFYGYSDPNPLVTGCGASNLQQAGIPCELIELPEIKTFYESYTHWVKNQKPYVTAKIAISLDAKTGIVGNKPVKLTSKTANHYTHEQRKRCDGILSTVKTIITDDPRFNARTQNGEYRKKLFLIGGSDQLPLTASIFHSTESITIYNNTSQLDLQYKVNQVTHLATSSYLDLVSVIKDIGQKGLHDLWVEAGATLLNSLLRHKLVDRLVVYISPLILGKEGCSAFLEAHQLPTPHWHIMGNDAMAEFIFTTIKH